MTASQGQVSGKMPWYTMTDGIDTDFGMDERHDANAFIRDGEGAFRTHPVNNRADKAMGSTWSYLDLTVLGPRRTGRTRPRVTPKPLRTTWWNWPDHYDDAKPSE